MAPLTLNTKTLDKYFSYLKKLDRASKKRLIKKLSENQPESEIKGVPAPLFGAWSDSKNSDQIIEEIRSSRVERDNRIAFDDPSS